MAAVQQISAKTGVAPERVQMFNLSSAMGPRFAEIALEMTQEIRRLGPSSQPCKNQANTVHAGEVAVHD